MWIPWLQILLVSSSICPSCLAFSTLSGTPLPVSYSLMMLFPSPHPLATPASDHNLEDCEFEASLGYIAWLCLKKKKKKRQGVSVKKPKLCLMSVTENSVCNRLNALSQWKSEAMMTTQKRETQSQAEWCPPVIPALRKLRQENWEFKASLGYIARLSKTEGERERERERGGRVNWFVTSVHLLTNTSLVTLMVQWKELNTSSVFLEETEFHGN
jgi:hypothetical protein